MSSDPRPSWDHVWMHMARTIANRSLCSRAKVGCVIVTDDQRVVSVSYNGAPPRFKHDDLPCINWCDRARRGEAPSPTYDDCPAGHAEANGIARSSRSDLVGSTMYVNGSSCMGCAKLIAQAGVSHLVHEVDETLTHRHVELVEKFLYSSGVHVFRWNDKHGRTLAAMIREMDRL